MSETNPANLSQELLDDFFAEADQHLLNIRNALQALVTSGSEDDLAAPIIKELFLDFHSFKGISAIVGLEPAESLAHATEDLLRLMQSGKVQPNDKLLTQVDISAKGIRLSTSLAPEQTMVSADPVRLQQVFWNVLKNAVKFTPEGGKITVETFLSTGRDRINIDITDTGIGMSSEELGRIFSAFTQGDHNQENSSRFGGLGLGLAISRKLVEIHSGQISASSNGRNQGSTFSIQLPLAPGRK